jgi:ABC-type uncharacterized transport system permease subunit
MMAWWTILAVLILQWRSVAAVVLYSWKSLVPSPVGAMRVALIAMLLSLDSGCAVAIWSSYMLDLHLATALQMMLLGLLEEVSESMIS